MLYAALAFIHSNHDSYLKPSQAHRRTQGTADMISRTKRSLSGASTTGDIEQLRRKEPRLDSEFDDRLRDSNEMSSYTLPPVSSAVRLSCILIRCLII